MIFISLLCFVLPVVLAQGSSQCTTPTTLYTCYVSYLEKYGYSSDGNYLPRFEFLNSQMMTHDLTNICRDFDDLTSCLGPAATYCVSFPGFLAFMNPNQYATRQEAMSYLQNHAFFEFVCGSGKQLFRDNEDCIQRSLQTASLTNRMEQCGQSRISQNAEVCPATLEVTNCVRDQMSAACGGSAGMAACGAAANIERRLDFLDAACLTEMDVRCSCNSITVIFSVILTAIMYYLV